MLMFLPSHHDDTRSSLAPPLPSLILPHLSLPGSDLFPLWLNTWRSFIKYSCYLLAGTTQVSRDLKLQGYLKLQDASWLKPASTHFTLVSQTTLRQSQQYLSDGGVGFGITVIALKICDRVSSPPLPSIAALAVTSLAASRRPDAVCLGHLFHDVPRHLSIVGPSTCMVWYAWEVQQAAALGSPADQCGAFPHLFLFQLF
ncbi:hypothetical protein B0H13DRAFT_2275346 [Mycena leptocephala]|nr:hypothetical protein B0H13DRAFT_2275346 [Mycena leptocephala]